MSSTAVAFFDCPECQRHYTLTATACKAPLNNTQRQSTTSSVLAAQLKASLKASAIPLEQGYLKVSCCSIHSQAECSSALRMIAVDDRVCTRKFICTLSLPFVDTQCRRWNSATTSLIFTPVSSYVSLLIAPSIVSPGSIWPPGMVHKPGKALPFSERLMTSSSGESEETGRRMIATPTRCVMLSSNSEIVRFKRCCHVGDRSSKGELALDKLKMHQEAQFGDP